MQRSQRKYEIMIMVYYTKFYFKPYENLDQNILIKFNSVFVGLSV